MCNILYHFVLYFIVYTDSFVITKDGFTHGLRCVENCISINIGINMSKEDTFCTW